MADISSIAHTILRELITNGNLPSERIAKPNIKFTPDIKWDMWYRVRDIPTATYADTLCATTYDGIYEVTLFVPPLKSAYSIGKKADEIISLFNYITLKAKGFNITIKPPQKGEAMNVDQFGVNWYALPISIYYHATTEEI